MASSFMLYVKVYNLEVFRGIFYMYLKFQYKLFMEFVQMEKFAVLNITEFHSVSSDIHVLIN